MTLLDLSSIGLSNPESKTDPEVQEEYPDEVLEAEWNPALEEMHNLLPNMSEPPTPVATLDAAMLRRDD